ncbi:MAG: NUDIX domain-containing protein [Tumebacillaceae bacterium]
MEPNNKTAHFYYQDPNAPAPNLPLQVGVAAFIERDGALLLERRSDSNRWSLIGGAVEMDEDLHQCVSREVWEETGLNVTAAGLVGIFSDPSRIVQYPDGNIMRSITVAFSVEVEDHKGLRRSEESRELAYIPLNVLANLDIVETHRHIVDSFLKKTPPIVE